MIGQQVKVWWQNRRHNLRFRGSGDRDPYQSHMLGLPTAPLPDPLPEPRSSLRLHSLSSLAIFFVASVLPRLHKWSFLKFWCVISKLPISHVFSLLGCWYTGFSVPIPWGLKSLSFNVVLKVLWLEICQPSLSHWNSRLLRSIGAFQYIVFVMPTVPFTKCTYTAAGLFR